MFLIVCLDDNGGMMFNHRRQSRDRVLQERILQKTAGSVLWMTSFSARLFGPEPPEQIRVDEACLEKAGPGEYCLLESGSAAAAGDRLEGVLVCKWNRVYPADQWFDLRLDEGGWRMTSQEEFEGSSHEKITMEVYEK